MDVADLGILASNWQSSADWLGADFDGSGFVDVSDLRILASNWQAGMLGSPSPGLEEAIKTLGLPGPTIPEPAGATLLAILTARILRRAGSRSRRVL